MNNDTTVNVNIGATDSSASIVNGAAANFGNLWKQVAGGQIAAQIAQQAFNDIVGTIGNAITTAGNFQAQLVQLVTGAGESQANLTLVGNGIKQIAITTGTTLDQLTSAMYLIESAGFHGQDGLNALQAAAEGAKASGADMATVANALTTVLHDYNLPASQATQVTNQMMAAVAAGKMHMQDFASSLATVLPIANQVGLSFAQVAGAEATLTSGGVSADQATQDLKSVISSLQAPTTTQINMMQQMGLSSLSLSQNLGKNGLTGTLKEISDAITAHMGPDGLVLQSSLQSSTVATQDLQKMLTSLPAPLKTLAQELMNGTLSYTDYTKSTKALPEGMTNLAKEFETTYNKANSFNKLLTIGSPDAQTYAAALKTMTGQTDAMNAVMMLTGQNFGTFQDNVNKVSNAAKSGGSNISNWSLIQGTFNQKLAEFKERAQVAAENLGEKLLPLVGDLMTLSENVSSALAGLTDAFSHNKDNMQVVAGVIGVLLIPALVALSIQTGKTALSMITSAYDASAAWIASAANTYVGWINTFVKLVMDIGTQAIEIASQGWTAATGWITNATAVSVAWLRELATTVTSSISSGISVAAQGIIGAYGWITSAASASAAWVGNFIAMQAKAVWAGIEIASPGTAAGLAWVAGAAASSYAWLFNTLPKIVSGAISSGLAIASNGLSAAVTWISQPFIAASAWASNLAATVGASLSSAATAAGAGISAAATWISQPFVAAAAWASNLAAAASESAATALEMAADAVATGTAFASAALAASGEWILQTAAMLPYAIGWAIGMAGQALIASGSFIAAAAASAMAWIAANTLMFGVIALIVVAVVAAIALIITHWNTVKQWFSDFVGWLGKLWSGASTWLYDVGKDIIQGLINGIEGMFDRVRDTVNKVASGAVNAVKGLLGIHSPSTVFAEIGQNMGAGLIQGLQGIKAQANIATTQLVTGSPVVNTGVPALSTPASSNSVSNTYNSGNNKQQVTIQNVTLQNGSAVTTFFAALNQGTLNAGMGLTPGNGL